MFVPRRTDSDATLLGARSCNLPPPLYQLNILNTGPFGQCQKKKKRTAIKPEQLSTCSPEYQVLFYP